MNKKGSLFLRRKSAGLKKKIRSLDKIAICPIETANIMKKLEKLQTE
jgi:hypothetical protein